MSGTKSVTLVFRSPRERRYFMGQLSDGWGENHVILDWDGDFDHASKFRIRLPQEELDEIERHELITKHFAGTATEAEEARLEELQNR